MFILLKPNGKIIVKKLECAKTPFSQIKGLMFRKELKPSEGLLIAFKHERKADIHMLFVFHPLDVILLNKKKEVIEHVTLKPWTGRVKLEKVKYVIELKAGTATALNIKKGDKLEIKNIG